ncbi:MAG: tetratricopeptide repeat protein [Calditrichaceae bacterium]
MNLFNFKKLTGTISFVVILLIMIPLNLFSNPNEMTVTTSSKEALKLFMSGRDKIENIENNAAVELLDKAIEKDPDFALAYVYRSLAGGGFNASWPHLQKAINLVDKVTPGEKAFILYNKAASENDGRNQLKYLNQLLDMYPKDKRIQSLAGIYYYTVGDYERSIKYLNESIKIDKNYAPAYNMIGYAHSALNQLPEADSAFKIYINLIPENPNPYDSYAEFLMKTGRYDESIENYLKAFNKDKRFTTALLGVGHNYVFKGDFNKAREFYNMRMDKAITPNDKTSSMFWIATSYIHEGKLNDALIAVEKERAMAEKEKMVTTVIGTYNTEGFILIESGKFDEGMKKFDMAVQMTNKSELPETVKKTYLLSSSMNRCYALTAMNNVDGAKDVLSECQQVIEAREDPNEIKFLYSLLAMIDLKKGNFDDAIKNFAKSDMQDPYNWFYLATVYEKKGEKEKADNLYAKVAGLNENSLGFALVRDRAKEKMMK